jgi:hypothetical protein
MNKLIPVILVSALAALAFVCSYNSININKQGTLIAASATKQQQVVSLPEDGGAYHLSLFVSNNWREIPAEREAVALMETDATLKSIKAQSHYHLYTETDPIYQTRFASAIDTMPCVLLQDAKGTVIFKYSGPVLSKRPWLHVRPWLRPRPCPTPNPAPGPVNVTVNDRLPDTKIPDTPIFPWGLLIFTIALAAGLTTAVQFAKRSQT